MGLSLAESLAEDEIPVKFRCVICKRLALDAFRLPCCDSSTCTNCHAELPETCSVCSHSPLSKDDCKPNKSLRQTIKAFIRSEEKKRQKDKEDVPLTRVADDSTHVGHEHEQTSPTSKDVAPESAISVNEGLGFGPKIPPLPSPDNIANQESKTEDKGQSHNDDLIDADEDESDDSSVEIRLSPPPPDQQDMMASDGKNGGDLNPRGENQSFVGQDSNFGMMNGFGSFGNWPMNGAMNGMNPMMAMQSGMGVMDIQNMMGMMGGMNPAMMQQMQQMMNFGGFNGGMGMNGMNGMGMGQMGFDNGFGGWGMPNAMGAMAMNQNMNGDFGNNGYFQGTRNNRGNFGRGRFRSNNFHRNDFRGHANGPRGFAGRKSSFQSQSNGYAEEQTYTVNVQDRPGSKGGEKPEEEKNKDEVVEQTAEAADDAGKDILKKYSMRHYKEKLDEKSNPEDAPTNDSNVEASVDSTDVPNPLDESRQIKRLSNAGGVTNDAVASREEPLTKQESIPAHDESPDVSGLGPNVPQGPAAHYAPMYEPRGRGRGGSRGFRGASFDGIRGRGRGAVFSNVSLISPTEPQGTGVAGAPTGPKALREGGPNIGFRGRANTLINSRGGRGAAFISRNGTLAPVINSPTEEYVKSSEWRRSRSRSPDDPRSSRKHSPNEREDYDSDYERKRDRKNKHSRRHHEDYYEDSGDRYNERREDISDYRSRRDKDKHRSSRHERDRSDDRGKHRHHERYDDDDAGVNGKSHESSRRHRRDSHRDRREDREERTVRPHSPAGEGLEERITRVRAEESSIGAPKREFKIQGRSKQSEIEARKEREKPKRSEFEIQKEKIRREKPDVDVYTLEREAAQRERLLKEEQRRDSYGIGGGSDRKRSRDELEAYDGVKVNGELDARMNRKKSKYSSSGRRSSHKYDGYDMSAIVDRAEREREEARY